MAKSRPEVSIVEAGGQRIPLKTYIEYRKNVRIASGKDAVLLRIPRQCSSQQRASYHDWAEEWIRKQWASNKRFRTAYTRFELRKGHTIKTSDAIFNLSWVMTNAQRASGRIKRDTILLHLPESWDPQLTHELAEKLIYRVLGRRYSPSFAERVHALHGGQFSKTIASVQLKNMTSKWGSCSHHGKLNLSTRLIFAPREVQDYVFLHELCHLDVLDHSKRFWQLVASFDPDYRRKEQWLRESGHTCDLIHAYRASGSITTNL